MEGSDPFGDVSTIRLYGGAVAVVSGAYSLWLAGDDAPMQASTSLMALVGLAALVHGLALFTPAAESLGRASGPLMLGYAAVMLLLQGWMDLAAIGGVSDQGAMARVDPGMVALAVLLLVSGVVMTGRRETMPG